MQQPQGSQVHLEIFDQALNIDPTNEDIVIFYVETSGSETISFTNGTDIDLSASDAIGGVLTGKGSQFIAETMDFGDNGVLKINYNTNGAANSVFANQASLDDTAAHSVSDAADYYLKFYEGADNSGVFYNTDDADTSNLIVSLQPIEVQLVLSIITIVQ